MYPFPAVLFLVVFTDGDVLRFALLFRTGGAQSADLLAGALFSVRARAEGTNYCPLISIIGRKLRFTRRESRFCCVSLVGAA